MEAEPAYSHLILRRRAVGFCSEAMVAERAEGILLYSSIGRTLDESVIIQGHRIRFVTVDLALRATKILERLRSLLDAPCHWASDESCAPRRSDRRAHRYHTTKTVALASKRRMRDFLRKFIERRSARLDTLYSIFRL